MQSTKEYLHKESQPFVKRIVFELSSSMLNIPKRPYILNPVSSKVKEMFYFGILRWLKQEIRTVEKWKSKNEIGSPFSILLLLYFCHSNIKFSFGRKRLGNIN